MRGLDKYKVVVLLRWFTSIAFFFLAVRKGLLLYHHGFEPYRVVVSASRLPAMLSYYGVVAIIVELFVAIGVWEEKIFQPSIILMGMLTAVGVAISIFLVVFKINSDCGCGLLGDNEVGLLFQKVIIIVLLVVLYRSRKILF